MRIDRAFRWTLLALPLGLLAAAEPAAPSAAGRPFVHPGLLHTEADFARMRAKVAAKEQPWLDGWNRLLANRHAQLDWNPRPTPRVVRGQVPGEGQNYAVFFNDVHAAYQLALRWKVSGEAAYAEKSVAILNAWSATLREVSGSSDRFLAAGLYGYQFANAAEIVRDYPGWAREDRERFRNMMLTVFYPMNHDFLTRHNGAAIAHYWANWDLCNIAAVQAIGVFCDRRDLYDEALAYVKTGRGNGALDKAVYYVHPGHLGQWQEAGRDQGHTTLGIALMGPICETAWNQGDDLYGYDNNRFLAGAEYVAKYNLGFEVPYRPYAWGAGPRGDRREQLEIAPAGRGNLRAGYELVVHHYVRRKGIAAPYSERYAAQLRPEGGGGDYGPNSGGFDQLGFGTLTATLDSQAADARPSGLTVRKSGASVVLSWWGAPGIDSYNVKRADRAGGPYAAVASGIKDPLTWNDRDLKPGTHFYVVAGVRDGKETVFSDEARISTVPVLRAHWTFDETAGTKAADAAGDARPGTLAGGAAWQPGKCGGAVALDGKDGHVVLPEGIVSDLSDFTIAAWVHLDEQRTWARIFDFGDDRGRYLFLASRAGSGRVRFATSTVYGHNEQVLEGAEALPTGQWVHVAVTLAGRTGTLYVNGVAVGVNPEMDFPPWQIGNTSRNWIGRSQYPNDPYLRGKVDDLRVYDGALAAHEVSALCR